VPVPRADELASETLEPLIRSALSEAHARGIEGSKTTPFLLGCIAQRSGGASLKANTSLLENNAAVAAQIAVALSELQRSPNP
jgi:pseudouridine-5'-phosphate glycosidase